MRVGIIGQDRALLTLVSAIGNDPSQGSGRLHHACLFSGPSSVGKFRTALALARALNCETRPGAGCEIPGESGANAGFEVCSTCERMVANGHPDLIILRPDTSKAVPIIRAAVIRDELLPRLAFAPHEVNERIIIIDDAHTLGEEAANALLKTLEEPPHRTRFILVTPAPLRLPLTVRSRCQSVRFVALDAASVQEILTRFHGADTASAERAAALAEGSVARALMRLSASDGALEETLAESFWNAVSLGPFTLDGDLVVLDLAKQATSAESRSTLGSALARMRLRYRKEILRSDVDRLAPSGCILALRDLEKAERALDGYANPQLCVEELLIRLREYNRVA